MVAPSPRFLSKIVAGEQKFLAVVFFLHVLYIYNSVYKKYASILDVDNFI